MYAKKSCEPGSAPGISTGSGGPNAVFATAGVSVSEAGTFDLQLSWPATNASRGALKETVDGTVGGASAGGGRFHDAPIINVWDKAGERKSSLSLDWPISSHSRFRHYFTLRPCIAASYGSMKAVWVVNKISQTKVEKLATLVLTNQKGQR